MSKFNFNELEQFYNEAILVFGELQSKKLLKKLPDDISNQIVGLLETYGKKEVEVAPFAGCLEFDSRRDGETVPTDCYTSNDITDSIWKGSVEIKGLAKGQKFTKTYCISHGQRLSFFAGPKKKPLKAQLVLSAASNIEMVPDGKKLGNVYTITELAYPVVTIKFSSVEEGQKWYEAFKASQVLASPPDNTPLEEEEEEDDGLLYEALEEISESGPSLDSGSVSHSTGEMSKSVSFASADVLLSENGSVTRSDSRHSQISENKGSEPPSPLSADLIKEEDKIAVLDEEVPSCWGEFNYDQVYQTEWSFNLSKSVLPGKNLLSLQRGQMVLVTERLNADWWRGVDCQGQDGFIAACFLSLAFEL